MKSLPALALFLIAISAVSTGVRGQNVYKCGTTYSQTPCPDGKAIQINDSRSEAQRSAAKQAAERDGARADAMEAQRLGQEKSALEAADAAAKAAKPTPAPDDKADKAKPKKEKKPGNFTAKVIESKKKSTP